MNTTDKKVLANKLAIAATYIDAMNYGNVIKFYVDVMEYSQDEARKKIGQAVAVYNTFKAEGFTDEEINIISLDTCTYGIPDKKPSSKKRTKVQGIKASFQSDINGCSYIGIDITKDTKEVREILIKLADVMEGWDYTQGEFCDWEDMEVTPQLSLFTGDEHTVKKLRDDYKHALIEVLN